MSQYSPRPFSVRPVSRVPVAGLTARLPALLLAALLILLAGCGGSGSAPTKNTPLSVEGVAPVSGTALQVTFNRAVDDAQKYSTAYTISSYPDENGSYPPLDQVAASSDKWQSAPVLKVTVKPDGKSVVLETAAMRAVPYRVTVKDVSATSGEATRLVAVGMDTTPPDLVKAEASGDTSIDLTFSEPLDSRPNRSTSPDSYSVKGLTVKAVRLSQNGTHAILTTDQQSADYYTVKVTNVRDTAGVAINSEANTATFTGVNSKVFQVLGAAALSNTTVELRFSRSVSASAEDQKMYHVVTADGTTALPVISAARSADGTRVTLTTSAQNSADYRVSVDTLSDADGNALQGNRSTTFIGLRPDDGVPPRVVSAVSQGNGSVLIGFSEPMLGGQSSAENPGNYSLTGTGVGTGAILPVLKAELSADKTSVLLTTRSQSEIPYFVNVVNVRDASGIPVPPADLQRPNLVNFQGTAPSARLDSDGDGLTDAEELRGYEITVSLSNGTTTTRHVTSDPGPLGAQVGNCFPNGQKTAAAGCDTDGDGVLDRDEKNYASDPRMADTDTDGLSDYDELNVYFSTPSVQDTDKDGLEDGLEVLTFGTSPVLVDTPGDGISDYKKAIQDNINPLLAYVPKVRLNQGKIDISMPVKFVFRDSQGNTSTQSRTVDTSLATEDTSSYKDSDATTTTTSISANVTAKVEASYGFPGGGAAKASVEATASAGYAKDKVSTFTRESAQSSKKAYTDAQQSAVNSTRDQLADTVVDSGSLKVTFDITNDGPVAYTFSNLVVTALVLDVDGKGTNAKPTFRPLATLASSGLPADLTIAPGATKGPFIFEATITDYALLRRLVANPSAVLLKVANFDLTDENKRNYAFLTQITNNRTGLLTIDYGQGQPESFRVATNVVRDANGISQGVKMSRVMQIVGRTYATEQAQGGSEAGRRILTAVGSRQAYRKALPTGRTAKGVWVLISDSDQIVNSTANFDDLVLHAGENVTLAFIEDADGDGVTGREEYLYGSSDNNPDSDGDGLDDKLEIRDGWTVTAVKPNYVAYSDPTSADFDGDGCADAKEKAVGTDPRKYDTDGDGTPDCTDFPSRGLVSQLNFDNTFKDVIFGRVDAAPCPNLLPFTADRFGLASRALQFAPTSNTYNCNKNDTAPFSRVTFLTPSGLGSGFTLSAWIRPSFTNNAGSYSDGLIIGHVYDGNPDANKPQLLSLGMQAQKMTLSVPLADGTPLSAQDPVAVTGDRWASYVGTVTYDAATNTTTVRLYKDGGGKPVAQAARTGNYKAPIAGRDLIIGNLSSKDQVQAYQGDLDTIRIFNRPLSDAEAAALYGENNYK